MLTQAFPHNCSGFAHCEPDWGLVEVSVVFGVVSPFSVFLLQLVRSKRIEVATMEKTAFLLLVFGIVRGLFSDGGLSL